MKILNLYAGLGGNRTLWEGHKITAVEIDGEIANLYSERFPGDKMIIGDCLEEIVLMDLDYYDFIWASPPCQTHSKARHIPAIPDLNSLYGLMIYLNRHYSNFYCIENVIPWYTVLIPYKIILGRHPIWANFPIKSKEFIKIDNIKNANFEKLAKFHGVNSKYRVKKYYKHPEQLFRNMVHFDVGKYILDQATYHLKNNIFQTKTIVSFFP